MADRQLIFLAACDIGDSIIAVDELGVGIFRIDKQDMSTHLLGKIEDLGMQRNIYRTVEQCNDEIFFFSSFQSKDKPILVYHLDNQCFEYINLREINQNVGGRYGSMYRTGNCLWLFPDEFDRYLIKFHLDNRQIEIVPQWNALTGNIVINDTDTFVKISNVVEVQGVLYHAIKGTNFIIEINIENHLVKCHAIPTDKTFFIRLDFDGELFWIAESDNQGVISWNPVTQETQYYSLNLSGKNAPKRDKWGKWISHVLCGKRNLWIIPQKDSRLLKMNYATGECEWIEIFPHEFHIREENGSIIGMIIKNGNIADLYPYCSNLVIHLDLENDVLLENYEKILLPVEWSDIEVADYQFCHELETDRISYEDYLNHLFRFAEKNKEREDDNTNGENIWRYIKNLGSE